MVVILTDFMHVDHAYCIRDARRRRVKEVAETLVESLLLEASPFDREREVRKHVADFTLFFTGLFLQASPRFRGCDRSRLH